MRSVSRCERGELELLRVRRDPKRSSIFGRIDAQDFAGAEGVRRTRCKLLTQNGTWRNVGVVGVEATGIAMERVKERLVKGQLAVGSHGHRAAAPDHDVRGGRAVAARVAEHGGAARVAEDQARLWEACAGEMEVCDADGSVGLFGRVVGV